MRKRNAVLLILLVLTVAGEGCGGGGSSSTPTEPPPSGTPTVAVAPVFEALSFQQPVALLQAPGDDSRWFVLEQSGVVRVFDNDPAVADSDVFLDLSGVVTSGGERGLLGMAFHPDFAINGEVFLSYTGSPAGTLTSFVSRFRSTDGGLTLDPNSEEIVLQIVQDFGNHNGGQLAFGPDGMLYIGLGDGGSSNDPNNRAQDVTNLYGTMLRIDPDGGAPYGIPADNPFAGNAPCVQGFGGAPCPEIFAHGFRNPWRWSFDSATGELWVGDVGQADWEEIDRVERGGNYGWRIREGAHCNVNVDASCDPAGLTDPVWEYDHSQGASVTGGYVYRGSAIPALAGIYVFGDFVSGRIWGLPVDGSEPATELIDSGLSVASFAVDQAGEIYVVDYSGGTIYSLIAS